MNEFSGTVGKIKLVTYSLIGAALVYAFIWSGAIVCVASGGTFQACGV